MFVSVMMQRLSGGCFSVSQVLGFCAGRNDLAIHQGLCDSHHLGLNCFCFGQSILEPKQKGQMNGQVFYE